MKITSSKMSPVEKERNKGLNFNSKFQAETRIKISKNRMNKIKISSLEKQTEFRQIRLKFKSRLMRHTKILG